MSLQAIRDMRMQRVKPAGVVTVIIGRAPKAWRSDADVIELMPGCQPALMDWRPLMGLPAAFYHAETDHAVMDAAMYAALDAGAKVLGFAFKGEGYSLIKPKDETDTTYEQRLEQSLRRGLELICKR